MVEQVLSYEERRAVARLHALLELLPTALDKELTPAGITSFEFTLLDVLAGAEENRMRLSALASRTNATLARLSRVVTSLEKKGLVVRATCEADGRATNAVLTPEGRSRYNESIPLYASAARALILDGLDVGGVEQLSHITFGILSKLDPDARLSVVADGGANLSCNADPAGAPVASAPKLISLGASREACGADPESCAADPV